MDGFAPGAVHLVDGGGGVGFGGEVGLDGFVHYGGEGDYVGQGDVGRGVDGVREILFCGGVAEGDFVLVVEPVLVVGAEVGVEDPLLEAEIAFGEIVGDGGAFGGAGVFGEVRDAGDDFAAPAVDDLLGLAGEDFAGELQVASVIVGEAGADFELLKFSERDGRAGNVGGAVGVAGDLVGDALHGNSPDLEWREFPLYAAIGLCEVIG